MVMSLVKMAVSFPLSLAVAWYSTLPRAPDRPCRFVRLGPPPGDPCQNIPGYGILWHSVCGQNKEG